MVFYNKAGIKSIGSRLRMLDNEVVGVCALMAMKDGEHDFELVTMAVFPAAS